MNWTKRIGHRIVSNVRFDMYATSYDGAVEYLVNRAVQLLPDRIHLSRIYPHRAGGEVVGAVAEFLHSDDAHVSTSHALYVLNQHRGQGHFKRWLQKELPTVITTKDCNIEHILKEHAFNYTLGARFTEEKEYRAISNYYSYQKAKRSGVPYMNHIDEGIAILNVYGANREARLAYCLHPIFQGDQSLRRNLHLIKTIDPSPLVMTYVMEYRKVTEAARPGGSAPQKSPLDHVNFMLKADKLQNWKDFQEYYPLMDPRTDKLEEYFQSWFRALGIEHPGAGFIKMRPTIEQI